MADVKKLIYFDNNATTFACIKAIDAYNKWAMCANPSSSSRIALPAKNIMTECTNYILSHCGVSVATHKLIYTSGGSESNNFIIRSCVKSFKKMSVEKNMPVKPHIITSSIEHHTSIACLHDLLDYNEIEVTFIDPDMYGIIDPSNVEKEIKKNTCLITIMHANNEVPAINNIEKIAKIAHKYNIPMHSDCVQTFGKYQINLKELGIEAISASSHKFYGPKGMGLIIISNELYDGYKLHAEISGSQQYGLRGGTENVPGIVSMAASIKDAFHNREKKNEHLNEMRLKLIEMIEEKFIIEDYQKYINYNEYNIPDDLNPLSIVFLGPDNNKHVLINTVFLSVVKNIGIPFCNIELKKYLDDNGIVVSISSACLTNNDMASHVLTGIGAPKVIKRGILRISFGDNNNISELKDFMKFFIKGIEIQVKDIKNELINAYNNINSIDSKQSNIKQSNNKQSNKKEKIEKQEKQEKQEKLENKLLTDKMINTNILLDLNSKNSKNKNVYNGGNKYTNKKNNKSIKLLDNKLDHKLNGETNIETNIEINKSNYNDNINKLTEKINYLTEKLEKKNQINNQLNNDLFIIKY
jgi:cysteine desulfurase